MIVPKIEKFQTYQKFLEDFYHTNKRPGGVGSYRYYAKKLKWPISYLNDVIQGRKKLTIPRAIEFGNYVKLDGVDLERLIYLCLKDSEDPEVRDFFEKKISHEFNAKTYFKIAQEPEKYPNEDNFFVMPEEIYSDICMIAVFDLIVWADGNITFNDIPEYLYTFPELKNIDVLLEKLNILKKHKLINFIEAGNGEISSFEHTKKRLIHSNTKSTSGHMDQFAENYKRFNSHSEKRGWVASGFCSIPKDRLIEVKKRMIQFRNTLMEIDIDTMKNPRKNKEDVLLFQLDLNIFTILSKNKLNQGKLDEWMEK